MTRSRAILIGAIVAASVAVGLFCCGGSTQRDAEPTASPAPAPSAGATAVAPATSEVDATTPSEPPGTPVATPSDAGATPTASPPSDAGSRSGSVIVNAVSATDPHDLSLYSSIERELHREPPAEVRAIVRRRSEGASREELTKLARELPDLQLRVLVLRWVDRVFGAPKAPPAVPGGSASGQSFVKPIAPVH